MSVPWISGAWSLLEWLKAELKQYWTSTLLRTQTPYHFRPPPIPVLYPIPVQSIILRLSPRARSMGIGAFLISSSTEDKSTNTSSMFSHDCRHEPASFPSLRLRLRLRFCQKMFRLPILEKTRDSSCHNFLDSLPHRDKDSYADCQVQIFFFFSVLLTLLCLGEK